MTRHPPQHSSSATDPDDRVYGLGKSYAKNFQSVFQGRLHLAYFSTGLLFLKTLSRHPLAAWRIFKDACQNALAEDQTAAFYANNLGRNKERAPWLFRWWLIRWLYAVAKRLQALLAIDFFAEDLKKVRPAKVIVCNGSTLPATVLVAEVRRQNIPLVFFERGYFHNTLQADFAGINGHNSLPRDPSFYLNASTCNPTDDADERTEDLPKLNVRTPKRPAETVSHLPRRYVFVPFQVPGDMQIINLSPWIKSMEQFYEILLSAVERLDDLTFVIKEHPSFRRSLIGEVRHHERIVFANGNSTEKLIRAADAVLTINSTVGIEALTLNKKVVILGEACYDIPGLVFRARHQDELIGLLGRLDELETVPKLRLAFLNYLRRVFLLEGSWDHPTRQLAKALEARALKSDLHGKNMKAEESKRPQT